ncbi:lipoyl(octanoyl) transferase LipB [Plantibacter flavus]
MTQLTIAGLAPSYVPYLDGWALQRRVHDGVVSGTGPQELILCEHESVYTAGKLTRAHERPDDGTPVVEVDRGGRLTWHGPGQLTGYPIVRLLEPVDVVSHIRLLEEVMLRTIAELDVIGRRIDGRSGVWVDPVVGGPPAKIGAVGVRVQAGVALHGFALNCSNSLEPFGHIVACGISDAGVTTISAELGRTVTPADVAHRVWEVFSELQPDWHGVPAVGAVA